MTMVKTVPGQCEHCGAQFEVPAETIGMATECPHCHQQTEVLLAVGTAGDEDSRKVMMWSVVGIVFLVVALIAAIFAVHLAKKLMEEKKAQQHAAIFQTHF